MITVLEVITLMCKHYELDRGNETKTRAIFKKVLDIEKRSICSITEQDLQLIYKALRAESKGTDESVKRRYKFARRVLNFAHAKGYIKRNPALLVKLPTSRRARIKYLPESDVQKLRELCGLPEPQQLALDCFMFQVLTGLSFKDLKAFSRNNVIEFKGRLYGYDGRGKTGVEYFFPLQPESLAILEKYNYCLPVRCNQVYNRLLKRIQRKAGIIEPLRTHDGRRTFGQHNVDKGMSIEAVSRMLGHASISTTERYYARAGMLSVVKDLERLGMAA